MATTAHRIKDKIKVPFLEQLSNLNPSQKIAIIAFLAGSMQDNIQDKPKHNTIFKNYKSAEEITCSVVNHFSFSITFLGQK